MPKRKAKAIGLLSGGLDSTLAHALMKAQGVEVKAITFYTGLCILESQRRLGRVRKDGTAPRNEALDAAARLETEIELVDLSGPEYLEVITHPRYGYGANANPCVDCRIFMAKRAKAIMEAEGADLVFTGEVLGQRPKSQRRDTLRIVERDSGLTGRLLRPLSAKLLAPTLPEQEGLIDRERLLAISGRSRKPQMALAAELGVRDWPQPAGGCCWLTDENFGRRFHDLMARRPDRHLDQAEVLFLATGRHFRIGESHKLVVGRNEVENNVLAQYANERRWRLEARGVAGPVALVETEGPLPSGAEGSGEGPGSDLRVLASRIVARYGKGKDLARVTVEWRRGDLERLEMEVEPFRSEADFERLRI
jgi:tRNA U34 2-thiouridine synthase MnmA/TrmU